MMNCAGEKKNDLFCYLLRMRQPVGRNHGINIDFVKGPAGRSDVLFIDVEMKIFSQFLVQLQIVQSHCRQIWFHLQDMCVLKWK